MMYNDDISAEMIKKAKEEKSVAGLLELAKANGIELTEEEAATLFERLHKLGELPDDELDNVAGGGCDTKVDGDKYIVVTSHLNCFNGEYLGNYEMGINAVTGSESWCMVHVFDHPELRAIWASHSSEGECGHCAHLKFKGGTGYCGKSGK